MLLKMQLAQQKLQMRCCSPACVWPWALQRLFFVQFPLISSSVLLRVLVKYISDGEGISSIAERLLSVVTNTSPLAAASLFASHMAAHPALWATHFPCRREVRRRAPR